MISKLPIFSFLVILLIGCSKSDEANQEPSTTLIVQITPASEVKGDVAKTTVDISNVDDLPLERKGIAYGLNANPTIDDTTLENTENSTNFTIDLNDLEFNTTYFVRGFAVTEGNVLYSDEMSFTTTNECTLNIYEGDIELSNQTEVDQFAANNYCAITGYLIIRDNENTNDPVTNLASLSNLRSAKGIWVNQTNTLETLVGFENVSSLKDYINISSNEALTNLDAFININEPLRIIFVGDNENLNSIDGLANINELVSFDGFEPFLKINSNPLLSSLDAIAGISISSGSEGISIHNLPLVTNIDALSNVSGRVNALRVFNMQSLQNVDGLSGITDVSGNFTLANNQNLSDFSGLQGLNSIDGFISISDNDQLRDLNDFDGLTQLSGNVRISRNFSLLDFCGITNAIDPNSIDDFVVEQNNYNPSLEDLLDGDCVR